MKPYLSILIALLSTASVGLAQAPRTAIVTGEIHNAPSRDKSSSATNPYSRLGRPNTT